MKELIDTNVLMYAFDSTDAEKHAIAREIVKGALVGGGVVSLQNIGELYNAVKMKRKNLEDASAFCLILLEAEKIRKIMYSREAMSKAVASGSLKTDFWDSVIYQTMLENGVKAIITENEDDFKDLKGIEVRNPFRK